MEYLVLEIWTATCEEGEVYRFNLPGDTDPLKAVEAAGVLYGHENIRSITLYHNPEPVEIT